MNKIYEFEAKIQKVPVIDKSIVNMGIRNDGHSLCCIIGLCKNIRTKIGKHPGDCLEVSVREREP